MGYDDRKLKKIEVSQATGFDTILEINSKGLD